MAKKRKQGRLPPKRKRGRRQRTVEGSTESVKDAIQPLAAKLAPGGHKNKRKRKKQAQRQGRIELVRMLTSGLQLLTGKYEFMGVRKEPVHIPGMNSAYNFLYNRGRNEYVYVYHYRNKTARIPVAPSGSHTIRTLYHGTQDRSAFSIINNGFQLGRRGYLGSGIYFGAKDKARNFERGALLRCQVNLGRVWSAPGACFGPPAGYDSVWARAHKSITWGSMTLQRDEWCVYNERQVNERQVSIHDVWFFVTKDEVENV
jgi:hypothetical protein